MDERDPLPLGADARGLIDQLDPEKTASLEHRIEIIHREADVMNPSSAARQEFPDRSIGGGRLQELDEAVAGINRHYVRSIRIGDLRLLHPEHVAIERQLRRNRLEGNPDVSDPGPFQGSILH